jgi:hypothetical protein
MISDIKKEKSSKVAKVGITIFICFLIAGCVSAPRIHDIDKVTIGTTRVYTSHVNLSYTSWFKGSLNAISSDGKDATANRLNEQMAKAGFNIQPEQMPASYILREVFAGKAIDYVSKEPSRGSISPGTIVGSVTSLASCALFRACNDVGVTSNTVLNITSNIGADLDRQTSPGSVTNNNPAELMVLTEVCSKRGCARSIAISSDALTTINQLRITNIDEGIIRAINIKK